LTITFRELGNLGRMGNQIFQYATLKSVGIKNNFKVKIPNGNYSLRKLNINSDIITGKELSSIKKKYVERFFHYDEGVFSISDWTDLFGYFQSYKYFDNIRDELVKEFINVGYIERVKDILSNGVNISVHVRRGDYLKFPNVHPFPGMGYYNRNFKFFMDRFENCKFYICSDDIGWCKKNFGNRSNLIFLGRDEIFDLMLMKFCDHNIISNSSFSWWGAYLNNNSNKIVIAPKKWFGLGGPQDFYDLIPKGWRII